MKKKLWIPLFAVFCLAVFCLGFLLADLTAPRTFDELWCRCDLDTPAKPGENIYLCCGPTWEEPEGYPELDKIYRSVMRLFQSQSYRRSLFSFLPRDGGIYLTVRMGCEAYSLAYWSCGVLWIPTDNHRWTAYKPSSPEALGTQIDSIAQKYCNIPQK